MFLLNFFTYTKLNWNKVIISKFFMSNDIMSVVMKTDELYLKSKYVQ